MLGHQTNRLWSGLDYWLWLGAVREFAARPLHPLHPLLAVNAGDAFVEPYMLGPYTFVLGLVTRAGAFDPVQVMVIAGFGNLALFVTGLWRFSRRVCQEVWAPVLALVFSLVAWGWQPWQWSGYFSLNSLGVVLPLGSSFAVGLGLFCLSALWDWLDEQRNVTLVFFSVALAVVILTHQPTGVWVAMICAGLVIVKVGEIGIDAFAKLTLAGVVTLASVFAWPFYSLLEILSAQSGIDQINQPVFARVLARAALGVPGIVILAVRLRKSWRDPLAAASLLLGSVFVAAWVLNRGSVGRVFPGLILLAHLAMADWICQELRLPGSQLRLTAARTGLVLVVIVGVVGVAPGWVRSVPRAMVPTSVSQLLRLESDIEPRLPFRNYIGPDDTVVAASSAGLAVGGAAAKVIGIDFSEAWVVDFTGTWASDQDQRAADSKTILDPATSISQRMALLAKYDPTFIVVDREDADALVVQLPGASIRGEVDGFAVIALDSRP
jgi:hypothetical protein